jgi:hypothetical protein
MNTRFLFAVIFLLNAFCANAQHKLEVLDSISDGTVKFANVISKVKSASTEDSALPCFLTRGQMAKCFQRYKCLTTIHSLGNEFGQR